MDKEIEYVAIKEDSCNGCAFLVSAHLCTESEELTIDAGLPDCLDGYIYKIKEQEPNNG
jgi:hypothetical protein